MEDLGAMTTKDNALQMEDDYMDAVWEQKIDRVGKFYLDNLLAHQAELIELREQGESMKTEEFVKCDWCLSKVLAPVAAELDYVSDIHAYMLGIYTMWNVYGMDDILKPLKSKFAVHLKAYHVKLWSLLDHLAGTACRLEFAERIGRVCHSFAVETENL